MKKIIFYFFIVTCVVFAGCSKKAESKPFYELEEEMQEINVPEVTPVEKENEVPVSEQEPEEKVAYTLINSDILKQYQVYPLKEGEEKKLGENYYYHPLPVTYILGFSKDGKMMWCDERFIDGRGDYVFTLYVHDLVSDEVLETLSLSSEDSQYPDLGICEAFLKTHITKLQALIEKYKIHMNESKVESFPGKIGNATYNAKVTVKDTGKLLNEYFSIIDYSCSVEKEGKGSKTITSKKDFVAENAIVAGYVKSPLEDRIAVIIAEATMGFEGIDIYYTFSGCDLNKNF